MEPNVGTRWGVLTWKSATAAPDDHTWVVNFLAHAREMVPAMGEWRKRTPLFNKKSALRARNLTGKSVMVTLIDLLLQARLHLMDINHSDPQVVGVVELAITKHYAVLDLTVFAKEVWGDFIDETIQAHFKPEAEPETNNHGEPPTETAVDSGN